MNTNKQLVQTDSRSVESVFVVSSGIRVNSTGLNLASQGNFLTCRSSLKIQAHVERNAFRETSSRLEFRYSPEHSHCVVGPFSNSGTRAAVLFRNRNSILPSYNGLVRVDKLPLRSSSKSSELAIRQIRGTSERNAYLVCESQSDRRNAVQGNAAEPYLPWLTEERDACGVGFVAETTAPPSHRLIAQTLEALGCMEHRGGCSADRESGDGAGVMTAIPWDLFKEWFSSSGKEMPSPENSGVGMIFLPPNAEAAATCREIVDRICEEEGLKIAAWRPVPVSPEVLGELARETVPIIEQVFVTSDTLEGSALEKHLYVVRRRIENAVNDTGADWALDFYPCSFSARTIVYKGMVRSEVLGRFYNDLTNELYVSDWALYHRRFSTNTMPKWRLAQPFRLLGHNGEINTLQGNMNWLAAREPFLSAPVWGDRIKALLPIGRPENSDSGNMDNYMELLVRSGRSPAESVMMMIPEAFQNHPDLVAAAPEAVDFFEWFSGLQEPWDGPALVIFSDGKRIGASLDRNGLRPARYCKTKDGLVFVGSEVGVVSIPQEDITFKGRLGPGQMIMVDLDEKNVFENFDIKKRVASKQPYKEWLQEHRVELSAQPFLTEPEFTESEMLRWHTSLGYTAEDVEMVIEHMASDGHEPTFCMGDDIPLAALSTKPHTLYDYFKQRFAQVTNPAIDPLREGLVMSLQVHLGDKGNILQPTPSPTSRLLDLSSPVLNENELNGIRDHPDFVVATLPTTFSISDGPDALSKAVENLCAQAATFVRKGGEILILSDRPQDMALSEDRPIIPPMLAVGAVHHHLIKEGLRQRCSIAVDTAQCWSTHHFACLIGYGASAVCPWLALASVRHWRADPRTENLMKRGKIPSCTSPEAQQNFKRAIEAGLLKILSKMGISLLSSYHGAQIFEAFGLGSDVIETAFRGTFSRVGGLTMTDVARETVLIHQRSFPELTSKKLENLGFIQYRPNLEYHHNNPDLSKAIHKMVRENTKDAFDVFQDMLRGRPVTTLRDLLDFQSPNEPIPLEEVEPIADIVKRFCTGGMSLGAISRECHETIAIGMNRLGAKSNSGEGGEDPARYKTISDVDGETGASASVPYLRQLQNGDRASSAIKQVASGRFGVTPEYLTHAEQIEIKIAQGAKPGEGGQLPGKKVSPYIAWLRRSKPGVTLISPPPHHDIYSIEDLAQLIFDLHQVNPSAKVSVKLVSEVGIGTVAAGVAKANADVIQISGHDGGTGASPVSSIKHAGGPWELGLTEVHRVLTENKLRERVLLRVDGGFKSGWDVVMGALMGGEEYGFGSIAMISTGCIMARICHTNNCPVGVASQREDLRARFPGVPGDIVNFFMFVAEEVRQILARLGYRSLDDVIGRFDLLKMREDVHLSKTDSIDMSYILNTPVDPDRSWIFKHAEAHSNGPVLDDQILSDPDVISAIETHARLEKNIKIINTDRSVGGRIAGEIAKRHGDNGFRGHLTLNFTGAAGQSFGAFNLNGMTMRLTGEANDYVGKGMAGGDIVITPPPNVEFDHEDSVIVGNTCLYGATGGILYANGRAGERFAVRNSLGKAVVEGAGDHCCEYMTGGVIVVLGPAGRNVAAGMTGGLAYFYDEDGTFPSKVNPEIVRIQRVQTSAGEEQLKTLVQNHARLAGSSKAKRILDNWDASLPLFWQVVPPSEAYTDEVVAAALKEAPMPVTASS